MTSRARQFGFTVMEIMIVVTILALLAAIVVPSITTARAKSLSSSCQNNLRQIDGAVQQYGLDHSNSVPASLALLVGTNAFIRDYPQCGGGGAYELPANLSGKTICSVHGSL